MKKRVLGCLAAGLLAAAAIPTTATAQSDTSNQIVQELRRQLDELRVQMSKMQAPLDELEATKASGTNPSAVRYVEQDGTIQTAQPPLEGPTSEQVRKATAYAPRIQVSAKYSFVKIDADAK